MREQHLNYELLNTDSPVLEISRLPELRLWLAVIDQAHQDAFSKDNDIRRMARTWIFSDRDDFRSFAFWCEVFGLSVEAIRKTVLAGLAVEVVTKLKVRE